MTVVLEYIASQPRGVQLTRPIRGEVFLFTVKQIVRLLRSVHGLCTLLLLVHLDLYYLMGVVANLSRRDPNHKFVASM